MRAWSVHKDLVGYIHDQDDARLVVDAMTAFETSVLPRMDCLKWQVAHNDPNPFNIIDLGNAHGLAFIDFGDAGLSVRLQDLATAALHYVSDFQRYLGGAEEVVDGYRSVAPLRSAEIEALVPLMRARAAMLIIINSWRAALFPAHATYIEKNSWRARRALNILDSKLELRS